MTIVDGLTHDDIGELAAKKLKGMGYIACFANITSAAAGEKPDALGVDSAGITFLVEAKISRADFAADKKKRHRQEGVSSIGQYRAFITPKGLLKPEEIPYGWQLWEVHGKNKPIIKVIKGPVKKKDESISVWPFTAYLHTDAEEMRYFTKKASFQSTLGILATILNRMDSEGVDIQGFASRNGKGFLKN